MAGAGFDGCEDIAQSRPLRVPDCLAARGDIAKAEAQGLSTVGDVRTLFVVN
jgi:hypothetical protein